VHYTGDEQAQALPVLPLISHRDHEEPAMCAPPATARVSLRRVVDSLLHLVSYLVGAVLGSVPILGMVFVERNLPSCAVSNLFAFDCSMGYAAATRIACVYALLYIVQVVVMLSLVRNPKLRFVGYGVATMLVVGPVIAVPACRALSPPPHFPLPRL
jgi:hypothetical protein